jgi:hypothetical protein
MAQETQKRVELSTDDRARMRRLSEEVQGRLQEMALITSRALDLPIDSESVVKFAPQASKEFAEDGPIVIEILCGPSGCGCYIDPPGICTAC